MDNIPTTGRSVTMHPREAVLNPGGRSALGDDTIRAANNGSLGSGGGSERATMVYKHRVFEYFVRDHLKKNTT